MSKAVDIFIGVPSPAESDGLRRMWICKASGAAEITRALGSPRLITKAEMKPGYVVMAVSDTRVENFSVVLHSSERVVITRFARSGLVGATTWLPGWMPWILSPWVGDCCRGVESSPVPWWGPQTPAFQLLTVAEQARLPLVQLVDAAVSVAMIASAEQRCNPQIEPHPRLLMQAIRDWTGAPDDWHARMVAMCVGGMQSCQDDTKEQVEAKTAIRKLACAITNGGYHWISDTAFELDSMFRPTLPHIPPPPGEYKIGSIRLIDVLLGLWSRRMLEHGAFDDGFLIHASIEASLESV